mmetsp:Transcript_20451/g.29642  ORF Transcript_20451/g.29642 Transcript_20451/m.29642 type:complete len:223 (+) Transcript_20451:161-829(+)
MAIQKCPLRIKRRKLRKAMVQYLVVHFPLEHLLPMTAIVEYPVVDFPLVLLHHQRLRRRRIVLPRLLLRHSVLVLLLVQQHLLSQNLQQPNHPLHQKQLDLLLELLRQKQIYPHLHQGDLVLSLELNPNHYLYPPQSHPLLSQNHHLLQQDLDLCLEQHPNHCLYQRLHQVIQRKRRKQNHHLASHLALLLPVPHQLIPAQQSLQHRHLVLVPLLQQSQIKH